MEIFQKIIALKPKSRGYHLITSEVREAIPEIKHFRSGLANIFIMHTSAALSINENADPTVRQDFETFFNLLVPENANIYKHTSEGSDDMTSHIKSSVFGASITFPIKDGNFLFGTWQGIYLCEFRNRGGSRKIVLTIIGEKF